MTREIIISRKKRPIIGIIRSYLNKLKFRGIVVRGEAQKEIREFKRILADERIQ